METATGNQMTIIDKSLEIFKGGSQILRVHQDRSMKALAVGNKLLQAWVAADAIEDEDARMQAYAELDQKSNDFLVKCGSAKTQMEDSRKPITQMMDLIKKMYTEEESKLDPKKAEVPARVQEKRNKYATDIAAITEKRRIAAEQKQQKEKERVEIVAAINNLISQGLLDILSQKKVKMNTGFNDITLATHEEKSSILYRMPCTFPAGAEFFEISTPRAFKHTTDELIVIKNSIINGYNYDAFKINYEEKVRTLKESLIARLPAKKEELQEEENQRILAEENRLKKEANDKLLAEAKNKKDREAAELKQKQLAEEEERRVADQKRLDDERELREKEQQRVLEEEKLKQQQDLLAKKDLEIASGSAAALFDEVNDTAVTNEAPRAKTGFKIVITSPAAWVEIFTFWYQQEGVKLTLDELEKKTLLQMKTFAENIAKKSDLKIESKHMYYESTVKAVNAKSKPAS